MKQNYIRILFKNVRIITLGKYPSYNIEMFDEKLHQTYQTCIFHYFSLKMFDEKYVLKHISSNIIKHDFFFFFEKIENFHHTQTDQTFHQTSRFTDV